MTHDTEVTPPILITPIRMGKHTQYCINNRGE